MTGIEKIAQERARQIQMEGFGRQHDEQHGNHELIQAAAYYCTYDHHEQTRRTREEFRDLIEEQLFPASWSDAWKKRQGFPVPTDNDLAKAGALIAAELDRRAAERLKNGTGPVMFLCPACKSGATLSGDRFVRYHRPAFPPRTPVPNSCLNCGHIWSAASRYSPATEEPEDELASITSMSVTVSPELSRSIRERHAEPGRLTPLPQSCHIRLMAEALVRIREVTALPDCPLSELPDLIENLLSELADRQIRADIEPSA